MGNWPLTPLGGETAKILWKNPNLTSAFSPQAISISDLSSYKYIAVAVGTVYSSEIYNNGIFLINNDDSKINHMYGTTAYNICSRDASISGNSITFSAGKLYTSYGASASTTNNTVMVPLYILGVS